VKCGYCIHLVERLYVGQVLRMCRRTGLHVDDVWKDRYCMDFEQLHPMQIEELEAWLGLVERRDVDE